ncbi:large conductance mechanosensitive channel protein MscL [uncultured Amnibacterium sp.]|uniref:large conductance mechanosensitive channel protein MscL n=1 Tax=uncultured Amnibacterium sp. TaxID=1631851 RepID=UPI0035CC1368
MKGFKAFILRGNVIDLAVAVVIGTAFTAIVTAVVTGLINPLIAVLFNASSLQKALVVPLPTVGGQTSDLLFGSVLAALINFVIVAAVVYFVLVMPTNYLLKRAFRKQQEAPAAPRETPPTELDLLTQIRDLLQGGRPVGDERVLDRD